MPGGVPSFDDAVESAQRKLSLALEGPCEISLHDGLDEGLIAEIEAIDSERFREELRYDRDELASRGRMEGFMCLLVRLEGAPIAYDFGYDDEDEGAFFSDSSATLIERKGIGSTLTALEAVYCYGSGYGAVKMTTEEEDEAGRLLRSFWERLGFRTVSSDPAEGTEMRLELTSRAVRELSDKYIRPF
jgi:GNAT superfamily N-acetyltransferase